MRKIFVTIWMTASLLVAPAVVSAHDRCGMMNSEGMMDGRGMGMTGGAGSGMMGMTDGHDWDITDLDAFSLLNLSPDQKSRLNKTQLDLRKQHWALMGKNIDYRAQLNDLYAADRPDPKKIGQVYASMFDIRRQMIESRIEARNRTKDVLTREQLDRLKQLQQEPPHHGMRGTMMDR